MKLTRDELDYLSAWAREEWEPACYQLPAHRLQLAHGVSGAQLIAFIKAWTVSEGKTDQSILNASVSPQPRWPWSTTEDFGNRFAEASQWRTHQAKVRSTSEMDDCVEGKRVVHITGSDSQTSVTPLP